MERRFIEVFEDRLEELIRKAREHRNNALHYDEFNVGCAILAYRTGDQSFKTFIGVNVKGAKGSYKVCSEMVAVGSAQALGYDRIIGIVVCGVPREEDETEELWCCETCTLEYLAHLPGVTAGTIIYAVNNGNKEGKRQTFADLVRYWNLRLATEAVARS